MTAAAATAAAPAAPSLSIRAKPPSPKRLSRNVLLAGALAIGGVVAAALMLGLSDRPDRRAEQAEAVAAASGPPDSIMSASDRYNANDLPRGRLDPVDAAPVGGDDDMLVGDELAPPSDPTWSARNAQTESATRPASAAPPDPQEVARTAPILFRGDGVAGQGAGGQSGYAGPRAGFLASQRGGEDRLDARLTPPRSRYELLAGSVIPAALVTELNSDLPGRVIAQVTAPVYDTVSGDHLLIPQGARLMGAYDSATTYGDRRLLLVWNRLIFPNGWSISLQGMEGTDPSGAAGLKDRADQHLDRLVGAIGLSAIISVIANEAEDDKEGSFGQSVGDAAAQEAARTGGRIVDREMSVRPTLRVRAGAPVRVLVTRDIVFR